MLPPTLPIVIWLPGCIWTGGLALAILWCYWFCIRDLIFYSYCGFICPWLATLIWLMLKVCAFYCYYCFLASFFTVWLCCYCLMLMSNCFWATSTVALLESCLCFKVATLSSTLLRVLWVFSTFGPALYFRLSLLTLGWLPTLSYRLMYWACRGDSGGSPNCSSSFFRSCLSFASLLQRS